MRDRGKIVVRLIATGIFLLAFGLYSAAEDTQSDTDRPALSGRWVFVQILPEIAVVPVVGKIGLTSTVGLIVSLNEDGATVTISGSYCFCEVEAGSPLVRIEIPDPFSGSLRLSPQTASLTTSDEGILFEQGWYTEVRGAVLDDPECDPLPESPDDPRVYDQDGDGKPGMTVKATILGIVEGERYIVNRIRYRLSGRLIDPDTILGRIEWYSEQATIGASNPLLGAAISEEPYPDPTRHRFVLRRVDQSFDCSALRAELDELIRFALGDDGG